MLRHEKRIDSVAGFATVVALASAGRLKTQSLIKIDRWQIVFSDLKENVPDIAPPDDVQTSFHQRYSHALAARGRDNPQCQNLGFIADALKDQHPFRDQQIC